MKNKFIFVATLVFSAMLVMSAFAADTWKLEDGKWFCYDKDNMKIMGEAKKSGSNFYYLDDSTGEMVTNKLVEIDGNKYWFGTDGAKVSDAWVQVPVENDDDGWEWMYFNPVSGKATVGDGNFKTIRGKKYVFDTDGYMKYGYLTDLSGTKANNVLDAVYYMGTKDEGWQFTGWQKFENGAIEAPGYEDEALVYFYFKNGKKVSNTGLDGYKINNAKYYFNEEGAMLRGYVATGSDVYYLGKNDDGTMKKKQWVKTNQIDTTTDTEYWYYLGSDGKVALGTGNGQIKKINGKYYMIAADGKMKTGVFVVNIPDYKGYNSPSEETHTVTDVTFKTVDALKNYVLADGNKIYYFSTDADNDGALKTGTQTVVIDDEEVTMYFDKYGVAYEGVVKNRVYNNGILKTGVGAVKCNAEDKYYLVNTNGIIMKKAVARDSDGYMWAVNEDNEIAKFADQDYASKAAAAWKNGEATFKVNNKTYALYVVEVKSGYDYVKYAEVK